MFTWVDSYTLMVIARGCYGFGFGFTAVIVTSTIAELTQKKYRGKVIVFENFAVQNELAVTIEVFLTIYHS